MSERILPGMRVMICEGSGLDSGKVGKVMFPSELKRDARGVPQLPGHYSPIDWSREAAIRLDNGMVTTMYINRLIRLG